MLLIRRIVAGIEMTPVDVFDEKEREVYIDGNRRAEVLLVTEESRAKKASRYSIVIPMRLTSELRSRPNVRAVVGKKRGIVAAVRRGRNLL